ncbi:hypothetical protein [Nocardia higoensis]|uniref:hypothetical protein n=1 Tax=Nocardia higoensis TaxID=228599 RepID=UPI000317A67E|nr:hypothetical protein [Nocardia higoensis]
MSRQTVARAILAGAIAVAPVTAVTVPAQADVVVAHHTAVQVDNGRGNGKIIPPGWGIPPGWWKKLLPFGSFGSFGSD